MNYKTGLEDFIGKESLSKTLRNALIPTESTKIHMEEMGVIRDDELRAEKQQELKEIMDDYYRAFIEEKLGQIQGIQWNSLFQKMEETMEDISVRKDLDKIQNEKRKEICCYFTSDKRFKDLFNAKFITDILPNFIKDNKEYTEEEKAEKEQTRVLFQRFATAFTNYFNQRRNNFSEDNISTAISFRIVNENSEIHLQNMRAFQRIEQQYPEEVCGMEEEYKDMLQEWQMKHIYSVDFYDRVLTQPGIEYYNGICGKINEHMNQFCQKNRINKNDFRMKKLHKQILCKKSSYYEIPFRFESDQEVYDALNEFIKTMKKKEIIRRCVHLGQECDDYDLGKIYISSNKYEQISNALYGSWDTIRKCIKEEYMDALPGKGEKKEEKAEAAAKKEEYRSIADIDKIISLYGSEMDRTISAKKCITEICDMAGQISIDPLVCNSDIKLLQNREKTTEIKTILDSFLHVYQWGQTFIVSDIIEKDSYFYSELEDVLEDFEGITTLYNHVRSYVTQKPYSTVKFKLHFGSPTLANGWSQSKEYDNNAILLMRNQKFYLGIFNVRNKPDKQIIKGHEKEEKGDYKKMFEFSFDYNNYIKKGTILASTKWKVYTNGTRLKRIVVNGKYTSQSMEVELTDAMEKMLQRAGIEYHDGKDLKGQIVEKGIEAEIIDIFRLTVQMRNSRSESEDREYDRLISPVLNDKGEFFDTATADKTLPQDADANGAYCIALKGLYEVKQIKENWKENEQFPRNKLVQDNKTWFDFMQKKRYL